MPFTADDVVPILARLVGFDTTSRHSNLALLEYVESIFSAYGVTARRLPHGKAPKASLFASIGPDVEGGVVLSGHTDVVPVDDQQWDTPPFTLTEKDGRYYGRGTADMKCFLAVALAALPSFAAAKLARPAHFAFSYDEEVGCLAAEELAGFVESTGCKPSLVIIGEPTEMQVVNAHKGILSFETIVTGKEAHSSHTHRGVNAVEIACELVALLREMAGEYRKRTGAAQFEPPYTTVHVGAIQGGTVRNIIPRHCRFVWEIRGLPQEDTDPILARYKAKCEALEREMKAVAADSGIVTQPISNVPAFLTQEAEAQQMVMQCAQTNHTHAVSFGTEAGFFQRHGLPTIVCGPGSIKQAHSPNEFIERGQIEACVSFIHRLIERISAA